MPPSSVKITILVLGNSPNVGLVVRYSYVVCNVSTRILAKVLVQPNVKDMNNGRR